MTRADGQRLVLVVDDDEDNREMYSEYLRTVLRVPTAVAASGSEALRLAAELRPAVVVLDMGLPGVDGWETARRLKREAKTGPLRIIALTGHARDDDKRKALAAGCDYFCVKPFPPTELGELIESCLAGRVG